MFVVACFRQTAGRLNRQAHRSAVKKVWQGSGWNSDDGFFEEEEESVIKLDKISEFKLNLRAFIYRMNVIRDILGVFRDAVLLKCIALVCTVNGLDKIEKLKGLIR